MEQNLLKLFEDMMKGKSFRLSDEGKKEIGKGNGEWWQITAINCTGTIDICSNIHQIRSNYSPNILKY